MFQSKVRGNINLGNMFQLKVRGNIYLGNMFQSKVRGNINLLRKHVSIESAGKY